MFDESKHPRDNDGKFAEKGSGGTKGGSYSDGVNERIRWAKENGIDLPLNLDGSVDDLKLQELYDKENRPVVIAYGFSSKERKNTKHHIQHAKEMGCKNQDEYERAAVEFFNGDKGKLFYNRKDKRFYRYENKTRKIAVCDSDGNLHTFFIARKGWINTLKEIEDV